MTDSSDEDIWSRDEIESPCVKLCSLHPEARICVGCHRTGEEIAAWSRMSPAERRRVMAELPARGARLSRRRGGRAGRGPAR
jgi:hypothetical protein